MCGESCFRLFFEEWFYHAVLPRLYLDPQCCLTTPVVRVHPERWRQPWYRSPSREIGRGWIWLIDRAVHRYRPSLPVWEGLAPRMSLRLAVVAWLEAK